MTADVQVEKPPVSKRAFTLIELPVVIAVIAILAGLLLPALSSAKSSAKAVHCANSKKQLQLAWLLYTSDNRDEIPVNAYAGSDILENHGNPWAQGFMSYDGNSTDNTNTALLLDPRYASLGPYTRTAKVYRCPEDKSSVSIGGVLHERVRSVSMNVHLTAVYAPPKAVSEIRNPSMQFVFLDLHPDSISSVMFFLFPIESTIGHLPGSFHRGGTTISFADGHVEAHRWRDPRTRPAVQGKKIPVADWGVPTADNEDFQWLFQRTDGSRWGIP